MRLRGRGPRDAPAASEGAVDARRLAPPGRNPFVHELRLGALRKAQVGSRRCPASPLPGPRRGAGMRGREGCGEGSSGEAQPGCRPSGARGPRPLHCSEARILQPESPPPSLHPGYPHLFSRRPCPEPGSSSSFPEPSFPVPAPLSFPDPRITSPDTRNPRSVHAPRSLVSSTPAVCRLLAVLEWTPLPCDFCHLMSFVRGDLVDDLSQCERQWWAGYVGPPEDEQQ